MCVMNQTCAMLCYLSLQTRAGVPTPQQSSRPHSPLHLVKGELVLNGLERDTWATITALDIFQLQLLLQKALCIVCVGRGVRVGHTSASAWLRRRMRLKLPLCCGEGLHTQQWRRPFSALHAVQIFMVVQRQLRLLQGCWSHAAGCKSRRWEQRPGLTSVLW